GLDLFGDADLHLGPGNPTFHTLDAFSLQTRVIFADRIELVGGPRPAPGARSGRVRSRRGVRRAFARPGRARAERPPQRSRGSGRSPGARRPGPPSAHGQAPGTPTPANGSRRSGRSDRPHALVRATAGAPPS